MWEPVISIVGEKHMKEKHTLLEFKCAETAAYSRTTDGVLFNDLALQLSNYFTINTEMTSWWHSVWRLRSRERVSSNIWRTHWLQKNLI